MTTERRFRPIPPVHSLILMFLLALMMVAARGPHMMTAGAALAALAAYHLLVDCRRTPEQIRASGRLIPHLGVYLVLCTLVVWATTGEEESPYWVLYFLPIVIGGSVLGLPGALGTSLTAMVLFLSQVPPRMYLDPREREEMIPELMAFCIIFVLVGVVVEGFAQQNRRQLELQQQTNRQLLRSRDELSLTLERLHAAEQDLRRKDRLAALGEMAAGMAHEIRNPLGIISSSAQLLAGKVPPAGAGALLSVIEEESTRLNALITEFLAFGRQPDPVLRTADLRRVVERSCSQMASMAQEKNVRLEWDAPSEPVEARADADMMQQVMLNLLLNALQAVDAGGWIRVHLERQGQGVRLTVRDNGPGIATELRDKVFNPFFTTREKGTGLGLANAYRIVESHGGTLGVESEPGQGACFILSLPGERV